MPDGYDTHADYMGWVRESAGARSEKLRASLQRAFSRFIETRELEVINFSDMTALDLAEAIRTEPSILKPILACCNIAGRAIERDLDIRGIDTYSPRLSEIQSAAIAGYVKPFLPNELALPAIGEIDRYLFVDKEIRARKGRWEAEILRAINSASTLSFKKRRFEIDGESFEIDAAAPSEGKIQFAIDIKRIEARRDIHKRADEIVNKASKFKRANRKGRFAAVIYYPFASEHLNVQSRLESSNIDAVTFASQSSEQIAVAIGLLIDRLGLRRA